MKKLLALSLVGSSLLLNTNHLMADYDAFGVDYSGDASIGNRVYGVDSTTGNKTLLTTKIFDDNGWTPGESFISSGTGELMIRGAGDNFHAYNWKTNTWRDIKDNSNFQKYFHKPMTNAIDDDGDTIQIGKDANDIDITPEGLSIDGDPVISKKANGELHIGKNSWITKEENGRQKVWAKDAAGNSIPIDYTNGTKLLINGRDVEQSINNVGALSAALTGLPTVPTDTTLACGLGTGTHGGDIAFSGGCASKVNEKLSINYAASVTMPGQDYAGDFEDQFSARAGFVWKLGKTTKPTQISMKEKKELKQEISDLKNNNKNIIAQNNALLARLERLEKVALGDLKSKDLAVYPLK
ncbi:YadA C-terminal domain-containing protein [Prochlorococcus sp. AH-716-M10]|nr:YadA C-terminal domain-containing protein [Prochlorococcus sp. AH-716-M10]